MRLIMIIGFLCFTSTLNAQEFRVPSVDSSRANKWDFSFSILSTESESYSSANESGLDISSETGWGFGIGYNLNTHFALAFDFSYSQPRYTATLVDENDVPASFSHKMTINTGQFKGIWNFVDGPLTPYAELGLGWTYLDSNVASSPPITGCWWDPFWGYICDTFYSTYNDTSFSYSGGLGVRWQITPGFFLRGSYNLLKIDMSNSAGDPELYSWRMDIGTSF